MAVRRFVALSLRTRIDRNHVILFRELVDLLLPDPRRHRPARNEDNWPPTACFDVVDPDAIRSFKKSALRRLRFHIRHQQKAEHHDKDRFHVRFSASSPNCTASCLHRRRIPLCGRAARTESFADIVPLPPPNCTPASAIGGTISVRNQRCTTIREAPQCCARKSLLPG